jgi:hypothetical protein
MKYYDLTDIDDFDTLYWIAEINDLAWDEYHYNEEYFFHAQLIRLSKPSVDITSPWID